MSSPYNNRTPESFFAGLRRKDSKNALTTCHGITDKGRACRRALASPKNSSKFDGAVVVTKNADDPAIFFCWQHKDQAEMLDTGEEGSVISIQGRHSLEDAFRSLGLDDVDEEPESASESHSPSRPTIESHMQLREPVATVASESRQPDAPPTSRRRRTEYDGPPDQRRRARRETHDSRRTDGRRRPSERHPPKSGFSLFTCCFGSAESISRDERPVRRRPINSQPPASHQMETIQQRRVEREQPYCKPDRPSDNIGNRTPEKDMSRWPAEVRRKEMPSHRKSDSGIAVSHQLYPTIDFREAPARMRPRLGVYRDPMNPPMPVHPFTQTDERHKSDSLLPVPSERPLKARSKSTPGAEQLQRLHGEWPPPLPKDASDEMRIAYAKLLMAMSEPPSKTDSPGYIYIFWQTEVEQTDDETSAVATIISAPRMERGLGRQETILQRRFFQTSANAMLPRRPSEEKRTIFLKIGRAANVHQRLVQWKKQCEYDISLLRSYPYDEVKRKGLAKQVPNVVKMERLIHLHLEMLGQRVSKQCRCGTEHKEWFEVDATSKGVRDVDEIVRKWVRWSEDKFT